MENEVFYFEYPATINLKKVKRDWFYKDSFTSADYVKINPKISGVFEVLYNDSMLVEYKTRRL